MIGYCGTGYHGMQVNPPEKTIEGDLFQAFVNAGAISKDNSNDLRKSSFMRAARTDKGVHAAGNVVSLKLIIEDSDIVDKINANLPETIRVWGISRTNKSFECRKMCSSRIYEYLIPSYCFLPPRPSSAMARRLELALESKPDNYQIKDIEGQKFWEEVEKELKVQGLNSEELVAAEKELEAEEAIETKHEETNGGESSINEKIKKIKTIENSARRNYRITQDRLQLIRQALKIYEGSHNFHNFTIGKDFKDPSAKRFMKSLTVSEPKIIENTEWLSIKIHGQSFMLHQIRKMIAMVALVVRTGCPLQRISEAFESTKINIPKAPSLGLLLEQPVYEAYNSRLDSFGYPHIEFEKYSKEIEAFKNANIYDKIYSEEAKENVFHGFFAFIDSFNGNSIFDYLTATGITADNTVVEGDSGEIFDRADDKELEGDNEG